MTTIPMTRHSTVEPAPADRAERPQLATPAEHDRTGSGRTSFFARYGLTNLDVLVMSVVVLITCAYTPFFFTWFWAPRAIMMFVTLPAGLVATVHLARQRDRAARWGLALIAWATLSAAVSGGFFAAFQGFVGQDTTVLFWAAALGVYSLGRMMSTPGRDLLTRVVLVVLGLHAVVGAMQMVFQIEGGDLALDGDRSIGLTPNAVYFGGFMAMGVALCLHRVATGTIRPALWSVGAACFGVALSFSGSRVAFGSIVLVAGLLLVRAPSRRLGFATGGVLIGVTLGSLIARIAGSGRDAASRLSETGSGGRFAYWLGGWDAFLERPVFGWGLGRFRTAIQGDLSFDFVASTANDQAQWDAHNLIVGATVAVGLPGLILLIAFVWFAVRSATGARAYAVLAVSLTWLLQPAGLMTLPLAMLLFGAAGRHPDPLPDDGTGPSPRSVTSGVPGSVWGVAVVLGLILGGWLAVAEFRLSEAVLDGDPYSVRSAASMYPRDPIVSNVAASSFLAREPLRPELGVPALEALERSVDYEATRPLWWTELANRQGVLGDLDAALVSARRRARPPTDRCDCVGAGPTDRFGHR